MSGRARTQTKDAPSEKRTKSKSPGRPKSPARAKSPARVKTSPSRTKSAGRPKSPARTNATAANKTPPKSKSPERKKAATSSPAKESPVRMTRSRAPPPPPVVKKYESSEESSDDSEESRAEIIRNSVSRFEEKISETTASLRRTIARRPLHANSSIFTSEKLDRIEPVNNIEKSKSNSLAGNNLVKSFFGLLMLITIPSLAVISVFSCSKEMCKVSTVKIPWSDWSKYIHLEISLWYVGFFLLQLIVTLVPLFKPSTALPVSHKTQPTFHLNGLLTLMSVAVGLGLAHYLKCPLSALLDKIPYLLFPSFVLSLLLSLFVHATSPKHKSNANIWIDFVFGRSPLPRFALLDFKTALMGFFDASVVIYLTVLIISELQRNNYKDFSYGLLTISLFQILISLDYFIFEADFLSSYFMQVETFGAYTIMGLMLGPFISTLLPNYFYRNKLTVNVYLLGVSWALFVLGFVLYRYSNHQKASFRKKTHQYAAGVEVIVSREGRNLLASGLWGLVRHPNYLGALLTYWAPVLLAWQLWPAYVLPCLVSMAHLSRIYMVEQHCASVHGSAWTHYTNRVQYKLVPYVF